jgi:DNA-directed RNA polymerase specialized sigma24 family protein
MRSHAPTLVRIEALYRDRGRDFFRFALARTGSRELAQDAVQEGFARAIKARRGFRERGSLDAWVARCVINAAHDLVEQQGRPTEPGGDFDCADGPVPDQAVRAAIRALPPRQREVLFLRFYLDFDYASIADLLDIEVGTVSATLHAARAALAQGLKEVPT